MLLKTIWLGVNMRTILIGLLFVSILYCQCPIWLEGDINQDETLDILDIVEVIDIIVGFLVPTEDQLYCGDMDDDGQITVNDLFCPPLLPVGTGPGSYHRPGNIHFYINNDALDSENDFFEIELQVEAEAAWVSAFQFDIVFEDWPNVNGIDFEGGYLDEFGFITTSGNQGNMVRFVAVALLGNILGDFHGLMTTMTIENPGYETGTEVTITNIYSEGMCASSNDAYGDTAYLSLMIPDVNLSFGELMGYDHILPINFESSVEIAGFSIELSGIEIESAWGGAAGDADFLVTTPNDSLILGNATGNAIQPGSGILTGVMFNFQPYAEVCFDEVAVTDPGGNLVEAALSDCYTLPECLRPGDMNFDGSVDILDIVQMVSCIMGIAEPDSCVCGDTNGDGILDILDIVSSIDFILIP